MLRVLFIINEYINNALDELSYQAIHSACKVMQSTLRAEQMTNSHFDSISIDLGHRGVRFINTTICYSDPLSGPPSHVTPSNNHWVSWLHNEGDEF